MTKPVRFSDHAILNLRVLADHGFEVEGSLVEQAVRSSMTKTQGYSDRKTAQINFDIEHVLRVVYEEHLDELVIITVYPGRKERYEQD